MLHRSIHTHNDTHTHSHLCNQTLTCGFRETLVNVYACNFLIIFSLVYHSVFFVLFYCICCNTWPVSTIGDYLILNMIKYMCFEQNQNVQAILCCSRHHLSLNLIKYNVIENKFIASVVNGFTFTVSVSTLYYIYAWHIAKYLLVTGKLLIKFKYIKLITDL